MSTGLLELCLAIDPGLSTALRAETAGLVGQPLALGEAATLLL
jgi:hypothetical protein